MSFFQPIASHGLSAGGKVLMIAQPRKWNMLTDPDTRAYLIDMAADSAKSARHEAVQAMMTLPGDQILPTAREKLQEGNAAIRAAFVDLLAGLTTEAGFGLLRGHLKSEKTARIRAAIESALAVDQMTQADSETGG